MRAFRVVGVILSWAVSVAALPAPTNLAVNTSRNVSVALFQSLEELARLVDISYCVGSTGIQKPFTCISRCSEFEGFELIKVRRLILDLRDASNLKPLDMAYGPSLIRFLWLHGSLTPAVP